MENKKYPPKIEKLLKERGLIDKPIEEKQISHEKAMKMLKESFTPEEWKELIEAMEKYFNN